jgi:hypothetical protein
LDGLSGAANRSSCSRRLQWFRSAQPILQFFPVSRVIHSEREFSMLRASCRNFFWQVLSG